MLPEVLWTCLLVMASQGKVFRIIGTTVLLGNNMLHVQAVEWLVFLMDPAVLAPSFCSTAHFLYQPTALGSRAYRTRWHHSIRLIPGRWLRAVCDRYEREFT